MNGALSLASGGSLSRRVLALLALLGTSPDADLLAHLFGLLVGGGLGLVVAPALRWRLRPLAQWVLAIAALAFVGGAWLCAVS